MLMKNCHHSIQTESKESSESAFSVYKHDCMKTHKNANMHSLYDEQMENGIFDSEMTLAFED